jgi:hypothetical protein
MTHATRTLLLDQTWDITLTSTGKIAVSDGAYATAQAVANEIRRFLADSYFDYHLGIPHFNVELGQILPDSALRAHIRKAALRVPDVAEIIDISLDNFNRQTRTLTGTVSFKTGSGQAFTIAV